MQHIFISSSQLIDNIGVVKGVPKSNPSNPNVDLNAITSSLSPLSHQHPILPSSTNEFNSADIRNSLDRKINHRSDSSDSDSAINQPQQLNNSFPVEQLYAHGPPISSNGALVPPPYRDPPPPSSSSAASSPLLLAAAAASNSPNVADVLHRFDTSGLNTFVQVHDLAEPNAEAVTFQNAQYRELIQLIKFQREKLGAQKADLTKFDAEIMYLETKEREQLQHIDAITREISKTDLIFRQGHEQVYFIIGNYAFVSGHNINI